ncbi:MAG: hypothetical protein IPG34_16655 [Rhodocyclaceae bacterium]|nr:hypothetical protein [Rhodocyclaceae bacterium]
MTITYSNAMASFKDAICPIILWLESGKASKTVTDSEGYATIGAGF